MTQKDREERCESSQAQERRSTKYIRVITTAMGDELGVLVKWGQVAAKILTELLFNPSAVVGPL